MPNSSQIRSTILCVDDDPTNLRLLLEILGKDHQVFLAPSGERALDFLQFHIPDLILLDVEMPRMSGYEVIRRIKQDALWREIPVIFLTAQGGPEKEQMAFELGAVDYILKPITAGIVKLRAGLHIELGAYRRKLEVMVELRTDQLRHTQDCILDMLANMTAYRNSETGAHIKRTTYYTQEMVDALRRKAPAGYQVSEGYAQSIIKSAKLHDIGKVAMPDLILLKPDHLDHDEFELIKMHTVYGAQIMDNAMEDLGETSSFLSVAREVIIAHHERWDGTGYPYGLCGGDIPLSARIVAIADVYDALISRRPYKEPFTHGEAVEILRKDAGTHFDPVLTELLDDVFDRFADIAREHQDDPNVPTLSELLKGI